MDVFHQRLHNPDDIRAPRGTFPEGVKTILSLKGLGFLHFRGHIHQAKANNAPAFLAWKSQCAVRIDGLMGAMEVADTEMGNPRSHLLAVIRGGEDGLWKMGQSFRGQFHNGSSERKARPF